MVVGLITICAISAFHHYSCELEPRSRWGALDIALCDKVCQWLATVMWFSPVILVSSTKRVDHHDINEISLIESGVKHHKPNLSHIINEQWYASQVSFQVLYL